MTQNNYKKQFSLRIGSRAQVMHGTALMTSGGLKRKDLKYNNQGKIVSKKKSTIAKKENRLERAGWITKKGQFGAIKSMIGGGDDLIKYIIEQIPINRNNFNSKQQELKLYIPKITNDLKKNIKNEEFKKIIESQNYISFINFNYTILYYIKQTFSDEIQNNLFKSYLFLSFYDLFQLNKDELTTLRNITDENKKKIFLKYKSGINIAEEKLTEISKYKSLEEYARSFFINESRNTIDKKMDEVINLTTALLFPPGLSGIISKILISTKNTISKLIYSRMQTIEIIGEYMKINKIGILFEIIGMTSRFYSQYTTYLTIVETNEYNGHNNQEVGGGLFGKLKKKKILDINFNNFNNFFIVYDKLYDSYIISYKGNS